MDATSKAQELLNAVDAGDYDALKRYENGDVLGAFCRMIRQDRSDVRFHTCPGCGGPSRLSQHFDFDKGRITFRCLSGCSRCEKVNDEGQGIFSMKISELPEPIKKALGFDIPIESNKTAQILTRSRWYTRYDAARGLLGKQHPAKPELIATGVEIKDDGDWAIITTTYSVPQYA